MTVQIKTGNIGQHVPTLNLVWTDIGTASTASSLPRRPGIDRPLVQTVARKLGYKCLYWALGEIWAVRR